MIGQQIARHFVQYSESPLSATQIINPFKFKDLRQSQQSVGNLANRVKPYTTLCSSSVESLLFQLLELTNMASNC